MLTEKILDGVGIGISCRQIYRQKNLPELGPQNAQSAATRLPINHLESNFLSETIESEQFPGYFNSMLPLMNTTRQSIPSLPLNCLAASQVLAAAAIPEIAGQLYRQLDRHDIPLGDAVCR